MRRLTVFSLALGGAVLLTGCYTALKQTRAPVSADCSSWPAPVAEGTSLVLRPGQVGQSGDLRILFADLDLNAGYSYPHYYYPGPYYPPGWWYGSDWRYRAYGPGVYAADWYGRPYRGAPVDVVVIAVCTPGSGVPTDRTFYLSENPWRTDDRAEVGPWRISAERLRVRRNVEAPDDSLSREEYWERVKSEAVVTLVVSKKS